MSHKKKTAVAEKSDLVQIATWVPKEFADRVDSVAAGDKRKRAQMVRILLEEALAARGEVAAS